MELSSNMKGAIAEQAVLLAAVRLGVPVMKPVAEHSRCDLAFDLGDRIWRVQVKWGRLSEAGDVVIVRTGGSWWSASGYVRTTYTEQEVDLFAVYCADLDRSFLLPASAAAGKHEIRLRLIPARNGQRACIKLADNFEFEGAIAQLGERVTGSHEVVGSSPTSSTSSPVTIGCETFRASLGYWMERVAAGEHLLVTFRGRPRVRVSPVT
jgi:hypothetical protein